MHYLNKKPYEAIEKRFLRTKQIKRELYIAEESTINLKVDWTKALLADVINHEILLAAFVGFANEKDYILFAYPQRRYLSLKERCALLLMIDEHDTWKEKNAATMNEKEVANIVNTWRKEYHIEGAIGIIVTNQGIFKTPVKEVRMNELALRLYEAFEAKK